MSEWHEQIREILYRDREEVDARIAQGIEENRKGNFILRFADHTGKPVQGVKLAGGLQKHAFQFGCNLFMLDEMETPEKNEAYKEKFKKLFNYAVLGFYWGDMETEPGKFRFEKGSPRLYRRPPLDLCVEWCEQNGVTPKAHCLNYDKKHPEWVDVHNVPEIKRGLENWIAAAAERYRDRVPDWEVTNETLFCDKLMQTDFYYEDDHVEWSFAKAEKYLPNQRLIINEAMPAWMNFLDNRTAFYMQVERTLRNGCRVDVIGMQYHMFGRREDAVRRLSQSYRMKKFLHVLDCYAKLERPLSITEVTIPAYSVEPEDEALQAETLVRLYRMWFSHPSMESIIYWNLADGYAAFAPQGSEEGENYYHGGLLRYDLSRKPAFDALYDLIHHEWHTAVEGESRGDSFAFRGFYGDYALEVQTGGKTVPVTVSLVKGRTEQTVVLDI